MSEIPEEFRALAAELCALAKKYKLRGLHGHIQTGFDSAWRNDIQFNWDNGRHGADASKIRLCSTVDCRIDIKEPRP